MGFFTGAFGHRPIGFAQTMCEKIARQFPPATEAQLAKKGVQRRLQGIIDHLVDDLDAFQKEMQLGWIGKARLGNALLWGLQDRGFSREFAEAVTEGIIKYLAAQRAAN